MSDLVRVLLVDDDIDFVDAVKLTLETAGYEIRVAHSATEGLRLIRECPLDLAIIDMMMEEPDAGAMLAEELRRQPELQDLPVILVTGVTAATGYALPPEMKQAHGWLKVDAWLDKPVDPPELLRIVREAVTRSRARASVNL